MLGGQNKNIESSQNLINFHMPEERLKKRV